MNLVLNYEKCQFMVQQSIVLGHVVSTKRIEVDKEKVDLITHLPYPTNIREIHSFLSHAGFYRQFIKDFSRIAQPLSKLLLKHVSFDFDNNCLRVFNKLNELLTSSPIIQPLNWKIHFQIMFGVNEYVIGIVLGQSICRKSHVICYLSKTLNLVQCNYSTNKKQLLAIVFALDNFQSYLLGFK